MRDSVYLAQDIPPFVMYCVNGKPRSSLLNDSYDIDDEEGWSNLNRFFNKWTKFVAN